MAEPSPEEKRRLFEAVSDFMADRKMRDERNPAPRNYSPFAPSHRAGEKRRSSRGAKRD